MLRRGLSCDVTVIIPVISLSLGVKYALYRRDSSSIRTCGRRQAPRPSDQEIRPNKAVPVRLSLSAIEVEINSDTQGPLAYGWIVRTRIRGTQVDATAVGRLALRTLGSRRSLTHLFYNHYVLPSSHISQTLLANNKSPGLTFGI